MSQQPDRLSEIPRIIVEGTQRQSSFFLERGDVLTQLNQHNYFVIASLNKEVPDLVYASSLILPNTATFSRNEQWLAETMYALSQPDMLGDFLQWESHGAHIVGYRLTQALAIV